MTYEPETQQEIFESLKSRMLGRSMGLTHFRERSVNHTVAYHGYAGYFSKYEHCLLAVQLGGRIETAGGPVDEDDLIQQGVPPERVDLPFLNSKMDDEDLDALAARDGITRDPGDHAEGEVLFLTVSDDVTIPAGVRVATGQDRFGRDSDPDRREYITTEEVSPEPGTSGVTAPVEAVEIGPAYNIGAGTITAVLSTGAETGGIRDVTNQTPIAGGEAPETNDELRERVKNNISQMSGGGTADGIKGGLVDLVDGLEEDDIFIDEIFNPPSGGNYVEVIVDGGDERVVRELVESQQGLRPTGIEHIMRRPTMYYVDVRTTVTGAPVNVDRVESEISRYFSERGVGEDINRAKLTQIVMNADDDIDNIVSLELETDETGPIEGDFVVENDERAHAGAIEVNT